MSKMILTGLLASSILQTPLCCGSELNGVQCIASSTDAGAMPGVSGLQPQVLWAPSRVPYDAAFLQLSGVNLDAPDLNITLKGAGTEVKFTKHKMQRLSSGNVELELSPQWVSAVHGDFQLVVSNRHGKTSRGIKVVKLDFPLVTGSGPKIGAASWLHLGTFKGPALFWDGPRDPMVMDGVRSIYSIAYPPDPGPFTLQNCSRITDLHLAVPANLGDSDVSQFIGVNKIEILAAYFKGTDTQYTTDRGNFDWPDDFGKVLDMMSLKRATQLAAGATDNKRVLVALADQNNVLYRCFVDKPAGKPVRTQRCVNVDTLPEPPKGLWVQDLYGTGRADIIVQGMSGTVTVWRPGKSDMEPFTLDTAGSLAQHSAAGWTTLAFAHMQRSDRVDLIGTTKDSVVVLLNDGKGEFKPVSSSTKKAGADAVEAASLTIGDLDKDSRPDVLLKTAAGELWAMLNLSDGKEGDGQLSAPVNLGMNLGIGGLVLLDGKDGEARRLITLDSHQGGELRVRQNQTQP